jgi:hypothetical protein
MKIEIEGHIPHPEFFSTVKARCERYEAAMREAMAMLPERPLLAKEALERAIEK